MAKRKIGYFCYNTFLALAALILAPIIIFRILANSKLVLTSFNNISGVSKPVIWVHAASKHQIPVAADILQELASVFSGYQLVITYSGSNAVSIGESVNPDQLFIPLPYPVELCSKKIISHIKPHLFLMIEDCFYPNLIRLCKISGSKVALICGRVDNRLSKVYRSAPNFLRTILEQIDLLMMSSVTEANGIGKLGAPLSAIMVSDAVGYRDADSKGEAERGYKDSVKQGVCTIRTLLGRNL